MIQSRKFDLKKFIDTQYKIYDKYKTNINEDQINNNLFGLLDLYFGQTLEELYEYKTALGLLEETKELIDTLMYIGSTVAIIREYISTYTNKLDNMLEEKVILLHPNMDVDIVSKIFDDIHVCRRMFPERKWHKEANTIGTRENTQRLIACVDQLLSTILNILQYMEGINEKLLVDPFELLEEKQNKFL